MDPRPAPTAPVTLRDIARIVGVSHVTVSQALRGNPRISPERSAQIQEVARRLGYCPNPMATLLGRHRSQKAVHEVGAEIAWLNYWVEPARMRAYREFDLYWKGAQEAAKRAGFKLQEFQVGGAITPKRLEQILLGRNIHGVLLPPHGPAAGRAPKVDDLHWSRYAVVRIGHSVTDVPAHRVAGDPTLTAQRAMDNIYARGYERLGLVAGLQGRIPYKACYLLLQEERRCAERAPILVLPGAEPFDERCEKLSRWIEAWRPDAIYTDVAELPEMLRTLGLRVPEDIALASNSVLDGKVDAGIDQNSEAVGEAAVELLTSLMAHNHYGLPKVGREVLIDGRWQDGASLPDRRAKAAC